MTPLSSPPKAEEKYKTPVGVKLAAVKELLQVCHNQMAFQSQSSKTKQGRAAKGGDACGAQQLATGQ